MVNVNRSFTEFLVIFIEGILFMLNEIANLRQISEEGHRRWFTDSYFDLIVWYERDGATLAGFQLCYDKEGEERALGLRISSDGNGDLRREIFSCIRDNGWVLLELQRQTASLEDVFRKLTR